MALIGYISLVFIVQLLSVTHGSLFSTMSLSLILFFLLFYKLHHIGSSAIFFNTIHPVNFGETFCPKIYV